MARGSWKQERDQARKDAADLKAKAAINRAKDADKQKQAAQKPQRPEGKR